MADYRLLNIMEQDKENLIDCVISSFDEDEIEQIKLHALISARAYELGIGAQVDKMLDKYRKKDKQLSDEYKRSLAKSRQEIVLSTSGKGETLVTIDNFLTVMLNDPYYEGVQFNLLANRAEIHKGAEVRAWTDADTANSKMYIEEKYHIHNDGKHQDALRLLFQAREFHPVRDLIDSLKWDGVNRVEFALHKWLQAEDTPYTREVSRLIFAGGINRLYRPGCKFDDVPILIGTKQGEGKSSFVRWLAMHDSFFTEITSVDGQQGIEQLEGAWICEIAELLALTRTKEQEAVKAYITRLCDKYRKPYDREKTDLPRQCVFIGTTNNTQFLKDKTGNRRFYPVTVHSSAYWLFDHEKECRDYLIQCWAEAKSRFDCGTMLPYANKDLVEYYRAAQEEASEDDWRIGAIQQYLDGMSIGDRVCVRQIAHKALSPTTDMPRDPTRLESNDIVQIMSKMDGWERGKCPYHFSNYGIQRYWEKVSGRSATDDDLPL